MREVSGPCGNRALASRGGALVGNRSPLQIGLVSIASPILLYLLATRLLAVSLPELSAIEFAYSRLLGE